jgi:hypothetical protein
MGRDVDDEGRPHGGVDEVVADPVRPPWRLVGHETAETGAKRDEFEHVRRRPVIGMTVAPIGERQGARPMAPDEVDGVPHPLRRGRDRAVGPLEILAKGGAEHARRGGAFFHPSSRRAVAAQFARGQIAQADGIPLGGVPGDRAAEANLEIVGVRAEDEQVQRHAPHCTSAGRLTGRPPHGRQLNRQSLDQQIVNAGAVT